MKNVKNLFSTKKEGDARERTEGVNVEKNLARFETVDSGYFGPGFFETAFDMTGADMTGADMTVYFDKDTKIVSLYLERKNKQLTTQLLADGWKWKTLVDPLGNIKILTHKWYAEMLDFLLGLCPKICFSYTFVEQAKIIERLDNEKFKYLEEEPDERRANLMRIIEDPATVGDFNTIVDFDEDIRTVIVVSREDTSNEFADQFLAGWELETLKGETKVLTHIWCNGILGTLLTLFPKALFTHAIVMQKKKKAPNP